LYGGQTLSFRSVSAITMAANGSLNHISITRVGDAP
jgi:hypothetical protein